MSERPVMIIAGGTGGHVFPALAVAQVLHQRAIPVVWLGTSMGLEARVVSEAGFTLETVSVKGLRGNGWRGWLKAPLILLRALLQTLAIMRRYNPRVVLGMGGYVTGPGGIAARLSGRPLVIHEQNAIPGLTNRLLARLAQRVLTGLDAPVGRPGQSELIGNPVRAELTALAAPMTRYQQARTPSRLLVVGGSLGALRLNEVVPAALAHIPLEQRPEVLHQAGLRTLTAAREAYQRAHVNAQVTAFIEDMAAAYAWCDLIICRAGALTISELAVVGVPAILVPYPHAVDDHQSANAGFLTQAKAAVMMSDASLSPAALAAELSNLLSNHEQRLTMANAARAQGRPEAAQRVADICLEVAA